MIQLCQDQRTIMILASIEQHTDFSRKASKMDGSDTTTRVDKILDLGTEGCSHLLENIADALKDMPSGQTLLIIANDPAAPLDIKVWSRQTGNTLLNADLIENQFLIQKK